MSDIINSHKQQGDMVLMLAFQFKWLHLETIPVGTLLAAKHMFAHALDDCHSWQVYQYVVLAFVPICSILIVSEELVIPLQFFCIYSGCFQLFTVNMCGLTFLSTISPTFLSQTYTEHPKPSASVFEYSNSSFICHVQWWIILSQRTAFQKLTDWFCHVENFFHHLYRPSPSTPFSSPSFWHVNVVEVFSCKDRFLKDFLPDFGMTVSVPPERLFKIDIL